MAKRLFCGKCKEELMNPYCPVCNSTQNLVLEDMETTEEAKQEVLCKFASKDQIKAYWSEDFDSPAIIKQSFITYAELLKIVNGVEFTINSICGLTGRVGEFIPVVGISFFSSISLGEGQEALSLYLEC